VYEASVSVIEKLTNVVAKKDSGQGDAFSALRSVAAGRTASAK